jgi:hypothetical protein
MAKPLRQTVMNREELVSLKLTRREVEDIVAFMKA